MLSEFDRLNHLNDRWHQILQEIPKIDPASPEYAAAWDQLRAAIKDALREFERVS